MAGTKWHMLEAEQALAELRSGRNGLGSREAERRLSEHGMNELAEKKKIGALRLFLEQFGNLLVIVLIAAALISFFVGEVIDGIVIAIILVINAFLGFYQERKAENALDALKKLTTSKTTVLRDGSRVVIDSKRLVPGDIILLEAGDRVPADCRILEQHNVKIDESLLTGESVAATKETRALGEAAVADRTNMAFSGTSVVYGNCAAAVAETGMRTEFGKIAEKLQEREEQTPLQRRLAVMGRQLSIIIILVAAVVFAAGYIHGADIFEMFLTAVSLAVAAIPEGLPAIVTITLAIGLVRMSRKNAIVRRLPSVESLGSVTVICCDKTGTLTKNEMTVRKLYCDGEIIDIDSAKEGHAIDLLLTTGMFCNNASETTGDPTEIALLKSAKKCRIPDARDSLKRLGEIPFDSGRKMMSAVYDSNGVKMFTKGAVEEVLGSCTKVYSRNGMRLMTTADRKKILEANQTMTGDALRVLAFAYKPVSGKPSEEGLIFVGLQAMIDPPRPEVKAAIEKCYAAGIKVVMITGDHQNTADAIARELGIKGKSLNGNELDKMNPRELDSAVEEAAVYARISPDQKVRITEALRRKGHIVAMSGDGVNDAPALKKADIGIAVGSGTDVTKEAADMVLTDDNFSTIVAAVEEGRGIYDNIKKFINYLLSANFGEVLVVFSSIMMGLPLPLLPLQLLWINILTDGLPALALGVEAPDKNIMERKPRDPKEKILNRPTMIFILLIGIILAAGTMMLFSHYLPDEAKARTVAFTTLVVGELFLAVNFRSRMRIHRIGLFSNKKLVLAIASSAALQLAVLYIPVFAGIFGTVPLGLAEWGPILGFCAVMFAIVEAVKVKIGS
jgi:Ca2+-transporting ATPase